MVFCQNMSVLFREILVKTKMHYKESMYELFEKKPLFKLVDTGNERYVYDTGTNKILKCEDEIYKLLKELCLKNTKQAIDEYIEKYGEDTFAYVSKEIDDVVKNECIFLENKVTNFDLSPHFKNWEEQIDTSLQILTLEITEKCNYRCGYCVYKGHMDEKRVHGIKNMSFDIAKKAIDYLFGHSHNGKDKAIGFYGGEPLLNFELVKKCVEYANSCFGTKKIGFTITTNGSLVTKEIAQFLFDHDFTVLVSVDGPKEIHDAYRKFANGKGTYKRTIAGLENLVSVYGEVAQEKIMLSMVYTPPFSGQKLDRISELWKELSWLPNEMTSMITYPEEGSVRTHGKPGEVVVQEDKDLGLWAYEKYEQGLEDSAESNSISNPILNKTFALLMQRPVFQKSSSQYAMNGCCVPGVRKLYVSVAGDFHLCEKISSLAPIIGHVDIGVDKEKVKKHYIDEYRDVSLPLCKNCWAVRLCRSCYIDAIKGGELDQTKKERHCHMHRKTIEKDLHQFCFLREIFPEKFNSLYDYEIR